MKKFLTVLLCLIMALSCIAIVSCGNSSGKTDETEPAADKNEFSVSWKNWNGDFIKFEPAVAKGTTPSFGQADPTRPDDEENSYTFAGWDPAPAPIDRDMVYTATYTAVPLPQHEVTSAEFAEAFRFEETSFTVTSLAADFLQLEDGTEVLHFKEEAAWVCVYPNADGTWTVVSADDDNRDEKDGSLIWYFEGLQSDNSLGSQGNPLSLLDTVFASTKYSDYTYNPATETYEANIEGTRLQLKFDHKKLVRCVFSSEGDSSMFEIINYGTTVLDADELERIHHPLVYLKANKSNQYDPAESLPINNIKKGNSVEYRVELRFDEPEGTVDYNESRFLFSLICIGIPEGKAFIDGTAYINGEDYSVEITMDGKPVSVEYEPMFKTSYFYLFSAGTKPDFSQSYYLTVKVTTLKDLSVSKGQNLISISSTITNVK